MKVFELSQGDGPVILGQPHGGTHVPADVIVRLNDRGRGLDDTDWHITRLYEGLLDGVTVVRSNIHRYVIDANRDPAGVSL
ncbi:MAG: N-formylglutamate amidohydrolase, partial [Paracoccaceae bacterium]